MMASRAQFLSQVPPFASPYDEGIAFVMTRGEGDASAA
jgi:hypothetical protein